MRYIRRVGVEAPGTRNEHIVRIQFSTSTVGPLITRSRSDVARDIDEWVESYRTHNDRTGAKAPVMTATSSRGVRYITTVANGRETDNLLNLPRI